MYVSPTNDKLPEIRSNHAETPRVETATKQGISVEKSSKTLGRRIAVAPDVGLDGRSPNRFGHQ